MLSSVQLNHKLLTMDSYDVTRRLSEIMDDIENNVENRAFGWF